MNESPLDNDEEFFYRVGWETIASHPHFHGANDEYLKTVWEKTRKGYYPREVKQDQRLEIFSSLD